MGKNLFSVFRLFAWDVFRAEGCLQANLAQQLGPVVSSTSKHVLRKTCLLVLEKTGPTTLGGGDLGKMTIES